MIKLTTVGLKKAVDPKILNDEILPSATKRSNFEQVAAGVCPHDNGKLGACLSKLFPAGKKWDLPSSVYRISSISQ